MTQEEKAKRYDEALGKARRYYDEYKTRDNILYVEDMEDMFPELKESEGEKIRNWLISTLKSLNSTAVQIDGAYEMMLPAIAWLEKQGEQKPADKVEPKFKVGDIVKHKDNPHLTYILKRFTDDGDYEFHAIGKDGNEGCTCFSVVKYQDEWELVEQKPVEPNWIHHKVDLSDCSEEYRKAYYDGWNNCNQQHEQIKAEQKPAWSEEDEKMIRGLIVICDEWTTRHSFYPIENCEIEKLKNWLKSLKERYTWKPSDAQMASITCAVRKMKESACYDSELVSLLNDLKKLKVE